MKYRLGDICTIAKGATGIMKAVPGAYPMVTLAEERKQHDEYQFDAAAVIVPLISSTGHGHASIKRIHYQEGKFALGTILCAVIPKHEAVLNPRYLFVYLQQFKDSVLVPLMKGAANVSLPLNKLASLEIEVPTLAKQQEVIDLAHVLTGQKDDLEALLDAQEGDTVKLRQALLREAMQGQLLPQDPTDEPAAVLLKKLQAAKAATAKGGKVKAGLLFTEEAEAVEGPFDIPANWAWARLGDITKFIDYRGKTPTKTESGVKLITAKNVKRGYFSEHPQEFISEADVITHMTRGWPMKGDVLFTTEAPLGNACLLNQEPPFALAQRIITLQPTNILLNTFLLRALLSEGIQGQLQEKASGATAQGIKSSRLVNVLIPLPPLAEQYRIVEKLEQLLQHCDALEQRIRESRRLAEQLLQTALREALSVPDPVASHAVPHKAGHQLTLL